MDQQRQGTRSTKPVTIKTDTMEEVPQLPKKERIHHVYMTITDLDSSYIPTKQSVFLSHQITVIFMSLFYMQLMVTTLKHTQ